MRNLILGLVFTLGLALPAAAQQASPAPPAGFSERVGALVQGYVAQNQFSGTVLVARDGRTVFAQGFGLANREFNAAPDADTIFRLGSITKQFTAASILQLVEQGKIAIDDPISKFYTAAPAAWEKVTIRHLLSHRSGIPSYTDQPSFLAEMPLNKTPEQVIAITRAIPLEFEPGTRFHYDNTGYIILGWVIEKVSGETYADYVRRHIFEPLGMRRSGYDDTTTILTGRAAGYVAPGGLWANAPYLAMSLPYAAGSLYSTANDLLIWDQALYSDRVISAASRQLMMTDQGDNYGFGVGMRRIGEHRSIAHSGGINGFSTYMHRFVDDHVAVIVLSNLQTAPSGRIADQVARAYFNLPEPPPPAPPPALTAVAVAPAVLDRYVGDYQYTPAMVITIRREGESLTAQAAGQGKIPLTAVSETEFRFPPADIRMVFPAGTGPAASTELTQRGRITTAPRIVAPN